MISLPLTGQGRGVCLLGEISGELYKRRSAISQHQSVTTTMKLGFRVMELRDAHKLLRVTPLSGDY